VLRIGVGLGLALEFGCRSFVIGPDYLARQLPNATQYRSCHCRLVREWQTVNVVVVNIK